MNIAELFTKTDKKRCGECEYYGGDINQGDFSCGTCNLIAYGKPDADFNDYAYHHSSKICNVKEEDKSIFEKRFIETQIKLKRELIERLKLEVNELENRLI